MENVFTNYKLKLKDYMEKITTSCPGKNCPFKNQCQRYTAYMKNKVLRYYTPIPYNAKEQNCEKLIIY
jgi:hypothetical protein